MILRLCLILCIVFTGVEHVKATHTNVQQVLRVTHEQKSYPVENYFTYFIDNTASLKINKISSSLVEGGFVPWDSKRGVFNTGFTTGTVWLKLWLQNTDVQPVNLVWGLKSDLDTVFLYEFDGHGSLSGIIGPKSVAQAFIERDPKVRSVAFNIHLEPGEAKMLFAEVINKNDVLNIPMQLAGSRFFLETELNTSLRYGLFLGLFLCISFVNIIIFIFVRERVFIWYGLYVLAVFVFMVSDSYYDGFLFYDWFFSLINHYSRLGLVFLVLATQLGMVMELLDVKKGQSSLYVYMQAMLCVLFALSPIAAVVNNFRYVLSGTLLAVLFIVAINIMILVLLGVVAILTEKVATKNNIVVYYIISYVPLFMATINRLLYNFGYGFMGRHNGKAIPVGLLCQIMGLGGLVVYRFYVINQERKKLILDKRDIELKLAGEIIAAQDTERHRIARDLHDDLGARLGSLKYKLADNPLYAQQPDAWSELEQSITAVADSLRNISHGLIDKNLERQPLSEVIDTLVQESSGQSGIRFHLIINGGPDYMPYNYRVAIYRIISECINNIIKHSRATEATLQLLVDGQIMLIAEDDGLGFDASGNFSGIGLKNMSTRVQFLKGTLKIDSGPKGTTIIIEIPKP